MTQPYSADNPQREPEPGQDVFFALAQLNSGHWKIRSTPAGWFVNDLAKRSGWVSVKRDTNEWGQTSTSLLWTTHKDTHNRSDGPARSLTFDQAGRLTFYATSTLTMHKRWARGSRGGHTIGDADYQEAQAVAQALFTAIIAEQRATFVPGDTPEDAKGVVTPDEAQPKAQDSRPKRRGP